MNRTNKTRFMTEGAVIAALYAVLTYIAAAMNLAYGSVQFRFSEALTILPIFTPAAIPGLAIGCFISNLGSPLGIIDWVFGTLATLLAAIATRMLREIKWKEIPFLAVIPPILINAIVIGFEIACLSDAGAFSFTNASFASFITFFLSVGIGQLVVCVGLGIPLIITLNKNKNKIFMLK